MSVPLKPEATELHAPAPKLFGSERAVCVRDCDDINRMFLLAARVALGDIRDVTGLSVAEITAMAKVCAMCALVVHAAARLFARSDDGPMTDPDLRRHLYELAAAIGPFMGEEAAP